MTTRLLTLTGTGGIGKTRLSMELSEQLKDEFIDGVCFVELAPLNEDPLVPQAVATALGTKPGAHQTVEEMLVEKLAGSELLLVLDNCEHLIQASAQLAGSLLRSCAKLRILATSREPLGISGEAVWRAPSLPVPDWVDGPEARCKNLLAEAMEYDGVILFLERAQQARADFTLTTSNVAAVSRICRRLDGIPLAIELAAARLRSLTPEDVDRKLDQRFQLLTGGSRAALGRHQTLRSLIDWSYDLLSDAEKALFRRLSVFAGGWTLEATEQVCSGGPVDAGEVLDLLTSLSDKSLVVADTLGSNVRYTMLETMRQYARDRLDENGEIGEARSRHLTHFCMLGETAEPHLIGAEQARWLARLEEEHDNIRAALEWSRIHPEEFEKGLRLAGAICRFWSFRGHNLEGREWMSRLLDVEPEKQPAEIRAKALHGAAILAFDQGDPSGASLYVDEDLEIRKRLGDTRGIANALNTKGNIAFLQGDFAAELAFREEGLAIARETGDQWSIAVALGNIGYSAYSQGNYAAACQLLEESLAIRRGIGVKRGIAYSLQQLGLALQALGKHADARALYEECLEVDAELGNVRGLAVTSRHLAQLELEFGVLDVARGYLRKSFEIHQKLGDRIDIAYDLEVAAQLAATERKAVQAAELWGAAERIREQAGVPRLPKGIPKYLETVAAMREVHGDELFEAAWQEGRSRTMEQAIELALS